VIKEVNQKFNELSSSESLTLSFYRKLQGLIASALKDSITPFHSQEGELTSKDKENLMAIRALLRYYKWLDENVKHFEKYAFLLNQEVVIVKSYKNQ
jgi:hypothetical protein